MTVLQFVVFLNWTSDSSDTVKSTKRYMIIRCNWSWSLPIILLTIKKMSASFCDAFISYFDILKLRPGNRKFGYGEAQLGTNKVITVVDSLYPCFGRSSSTLTYLFSMYL